MQHITVFYVAFFPLSLTDVTRLVIHKTLPHKTKKKTRANLQGDQLVIIGGVTLNFIIKKTSNSCWVSRQPVAQLTRSFYNSTDEGLY